MTEQAITYTTTIEQPRAHVWQILADFGNVSNISPGVKASRLTSSQEEVGLGTTRHCDLALFGATLDERIVEWEERKLLGIDIYETSRLPIVKDQYATFRLADEGDGTRLSATFRYRVGAGPVGRMMHAMVMRKQLDQGWRQFVAGIKLHAETGAVIELRTEVPEQAAVLVP